MVRKTKKADAPALPEKQASEETGERKAAPRRKAPADTSTATSSPIRRKKGALPTEEAPAPSPTLPPADTPAPSPAPRSRRKTVPPVEVAAVQEESPATVKEAAPAATARPTRKRAVKEASTVEAVPAESPAMEESPAPKAARNSRKSPEAPRESTPVSKESAIPAAEARKKKSSTQQPTLPVDREEKTVDSAPAAEASTAGTDEGKALSRRAEPQKKGARAPRESRPEHETPTRRPVEQPLPTEPALPPVPTTPAEPVLAFGPIALIDEAEMVEPENSIPEITLKELSPRLQEAASQAGWTGLMPVQAKTIPYVLAGRDLMVQSRTGSGKTGAFVLPILDRVDPELAACQALILVPTRELAQQVSREVATLSGGSGVRAVAVYGGVGYEPQLEAFRAGAHIVVGTPGRILDHLLRHNLSLDELKILVFDEADRMLSMGFYPDMIKVKRYLPRKPMNAYLFSATYPSYVQRLAGEFLKDPQFLSLSRDKVHVAEIEHLYYEAPALDKDRVLVRIIEMENPSSAIVFANTKARVHYLSVVLQRFGYDAEELSADIAQGARQRIMDRLRRGELRILVATDVAARGIDIPELSHVFQYEVGEDPESYIHRAGRTGRAGASGTAITLVSGSKEVDRLRSVARQYTIDIQKRVPPVEEEVAEVVSQRVTALLEAEFRALDQVQTTRVQRFIPLVLSLGEDSDEAGLLAMLLDRYYQEKVQALPPHPPAAAEERPRHSDQSPTRDRGPRRDRGWGREGERRQEAAPQPAAMDSSQESAPAGKGQPPTEGGEGARRRRRRRRR